MERLINMASFAEVVEAGGFSAAAERLSCSRAVVSKRVAALEADFGVTLLHRTTRRQSLTEAGRVLYDHCRRVLDEMTSAETRINELASTPRGTLRVSAPYAYATRILSPQLPAFLKRYPEIQLELHLSDQFADLAGASVDIAVRMTDAPSPGLVARKLMDVPYVICASPAYFKRRGVPRKPKDLLDHDCLYYGDGSFHNPWHFDGPGGHHVIEVRGPLCVNSIDILRTAALNDVGIVSISQYQVSEELARGRLVTALDDYRQPQRAIYLVTLPDRLLPAKTRAFIDFLWQPVVKVRRAR